MKAEQLGLCRSAGVVAGARTDGEVLPARFHDPVGSCRAGAGTASLMRRRHLPLLMVGSLVKATLPEISVGEVIRLITDGV